MYLTEIINNDGSEYFDWETYFSGADSEPGIEQLNPTKMIVRLREHLKEDKHLLAFVMRRLLKQLFKGLKIESPRLLELGAATGFLTRFIINQYGGGGVLVDRSEASFEAYKAMQDPIKNKIKYINVDLFDLEQDETYDLVCSFGLIEHFKEKGPVLAAHERYRAPGGYLLVLVPQDSPLTRAFLECHPELNLGYRELLTEKELKQLLKDNGFNIINAGVSRGYCYDFIGAVCTK
jgi:SAM-dependent methyltransferase